MDPQSISVKRAQVEFHNFASLGEPERAMAAYLEENARRGAVIREHREFIGELSPFLEIGANAGHTSYMLANEFGASGFALDISADALRHGIALMDRWQLARAPVRVAGDALNLPFRDGSIRFVMACQVLSQFMDIARVFQEVKRVLAPSGVFLFAEEPMLRRLSLRLYRAPYVPRMKRWERKLFDWGLLGYLVRDVIGADQEESFGIRQNHRLTLTDWHRLVTSHFPEHRYNVYVPERGWGERVMKRLAVRLDPYRSEWRAAHLLGGTLAATCKVGPQPVVHGPCPLSPGLPNSQPWEGLLRCPDCHSPLVRDATGALFCTSCPYRAADEGGVFNLLPSRLRAELYPGDRPDVIDFSLPGHSARLGDGWYELEGVFGNKYRWIGARASAVLRPAGVAPHRLRVRGFAHQLQFQQGQPVHVSVLANGHGAAARTLERPGLFVIEADLPEASEYTIEIAASPTWTVADEDRTFSVNIGMIRLIPG
jgi:ubiquinone/menaquinone biosynthesis C-methylase UbiE